MAASARGEWGSRGQDREWGRTQRCRISRYQTLLPSAWRYFPLLSRPYSMLYEEKEFCYLILTINKHHPSYSWGPERTPSRTKTRAGVFALWICSWLHFIVLQGAPGLPSHASSFRELLPTLEQPWVLWKGSVPVAASNWALRGRVSPSPSWSCRSQLLLN